MSAALYHQERARRLGASARGPLTLAALAEQAGVTRRTALNEIRRGCLAAVREPLAGYRSRTRWIVDPAEAARWLRTYRPHARAERRAA